MSIQSNVNQMLSIGALLASQNPALKAQAEARAKSTQLAKEASGLEKQMEIEKAHHQGRSTIGIDTKKSMVDVRRKQYEMNPTEEAYQALKKAENALKGARAQKQSGRAPADLLSLPTNMGGTVGSLPQEWINQIQAEIPKKQVKKMVEDVKK